MRVEIRPGPPCFTAPCTICRLAPVSPPSPAAAPSPSRRSSPPCARRRPRAPSKPLPDFNSDDSSSPLRRAAASAPPLPSPWPQRNAHDPAAVASSTPARHASPTPHGKTLNGDGDVDGDGDAFAHAIARADAVQAQGADPHGLGKVTARSRDGRAVAGAPREQGMRKAFSGGDAAARTLKDPFQAYMDEISRTDVLGHASVVALARRIKEGAMVEKAQEKLMRAAKGVWPTLPRLAKEIGRSPDEVQAMLNRGTVAKNDLVAANLRLVTSVAKKIQASKTGTAGLALDDMIQEGNFGLIRAAEKYDASRGYRFSTYATWWVRASVLRAITTQSRAIKVPSSVVEDFARIQKERKRQVAAGVIAPDDQSIAEALGITVAKVRFVTSSVSRRVASLDVTLGPVGSELASKTLVDIIAGEEEIEESMVEAMQKRELDAVLRRQLKPMERAAVRLRFGLDDGHARTLVEVGKLLSISKERVRQHVFSALSKLNTPEVKKFLTEYLN